MPSEDTKILEFNQYQKSDKAWFIIYADLECIIEKTDGCENSAENSSITKVREHISSGFSTSTISSFGSTKNKHDIHRGKDCRKKVLWILKKASNENNLKIKKTKLLTKQKESYENVKFWK